MNIEIIYYFHVSILTDTAGLAVATRQHPAKNSREIMDFILTECSGLVISSMDLLAFYMQALTKSRLLISLIVVAWSFFLC